eukprot:gb/GFBE01074519.1/.p1 GENE.gb/GFBE01074519.1/~~gb/GFBE01074519.1/.p1  ORF type:complete len:204 (+),score=65.92 gb/GFBE01074519.1/:1-612(+)
MPFPYGASYCEKDVVGLFDALAPAWKKDAKDVPDLDVAKLFATLKRVYEEWKKEENFDVLDRDLQALLAMATATSWFSKAQSDDIDVWLGEVADCGESEDWMEHFPEDELREIVLEKLKAREIGEVSHDNIGKAISVEYIGGNYGTGRHDGSVHLSDDALKIYDGRESGKVMLWWGDLPEDIEQLGKCLSGHKWEETWEEEVY